MEENSPIPTFAVVGKVNMGKTSILSTLLEQDDNEVLRVSSTPGETTRCHDHVLKLGEKELIKFVDTPGFSRPLEAMLEIRQFHGDSEGTPDRAAIRHFITHYKESEEFQDEILLLEPLLSGVGIIYVIDTSRPIRDSYAAEMEILRWTGCQRLALINQQSDSENLNEWREKLGSFFNLVRTFNAHKATYGERIHLLQSLLAIDDSNQKQIKETIQAIELDWDSRRETSAELIMEFVQKCLMHHESISISKRDCENEVRKEREIEKLKKEYLHSISKYQKKCVEKLIKLYRHRYIESEMNDSMFSNLDLEAEETWTKWGLSRNQLAVAGGITGVTAGGAVDISTLGQHMA